MTTTTVPTPTCGIEAYVKGEYAIGQGQTGSYEACQTSCANTQGCVSFQIDKEYLVCNLLDQPAAIAQGSANPNYFIYDLSCPDPYPPVTSTTTSSQIITTTTTTTSIPTLTCGVGAFSNGLYDIGPGQTGSYESCQTSCANKQNCLSFQISPDYSVCNLLNRPAANAQSGATDSCYIYDLACPDPNPPITSTSTSSRITTTTTANTATATDTTTSTTHITITTIDSTTTADTTTTS